MIIQSASVLAGLREKERRHAHDRSQHLLCPRCRVRTRLYTLGDGRKKCARCGKKFTAHRKTDEIRLREFATILLAFCLGFPAAEAARLTRYRLRLVIALYRHFRLLLAARTLEPGKMALLQSIERHDRAVHESDICRQCARRYACKGRRSGDAPVFGIQLLSGGRVFVDPVSHDELPAGEKGYAGFVCRGAFHRFGGNHPRRDGAERSWAWMAERLRRHHGIRHANVGLYLKELEWKYNHRKLSPEEQTQSIVALLPGGFLAHWPARAR